MGEPASEELNLENERKAVERLRLTAESEGTEAKPEDFVIIDGKYRVVSALSPSAATAASAVPPLTTPPVVAGPPLPL